MMGVGLCACKLLVGVEIAKSVAFIAAPSEDALERCIKSSCLKIAEHYSVFVGDKGLKEKCLGKQTDGSFDSRHRRAFSGFHFFTHPDTGTNF